jgi:FkbM family methyltransferase
MGTAVIEVGVNLGQDTPILISTEHQYYGFEPVYQLIPALLEKFHQHKNAVFIPMAVDVENGIKQLNIANYHDWGCSSLHQFSDDIRQTWPDNPAFFGMIQNVLTIRLDTFCDLYKIDRIEEMWIDAQGNDFNVLKSLGKYIDVVEKGRLEVAYNVNLYKDVDNSYDSVVKWLTEKNFKFDVLFDNTPQKAEANIIFYR